jgi:hypothetical protein
MARVATVKSCTCGAVRYKLLPMGAQRISRWVRWP